MFQVHILPWAPPGSLAAGTLGLEFSKLGTLALGFLWLVVNRVLPLAASLQLLSLWSSFGLISQTITKGAPQWQEKAMATHSSNVAWEIQWTEEPGGLQSMRSRRVRHDWATSLSRTREGNGNPPQYSCLENPRDGSLVDCHLWGHTESDTSDET